MECGGNLLEGGMNTKEYLTKVCDWRWRQVTGEWAAQEILQEHEYCRASKKNALCMTSFD